MGLVFDVAASALAYGVPWCVWGIWGWVCVLLAIINIGVLQITGDFGTNRNHRTFSRAVASIEMTLPGGVCIWALGLGGLPLLLGGLAALLALLVVVVGLSSWRQKREFRQRYQRIQAEKRARPDWTGKECLACGKPVPITTRAGNHCPHCHIEFAREIRG